MTGNNVVFYNWYLSGEKKSQATPTKQDLWGGGEVIRKNNNSYTRAMAKKSIQAGLVSRKLACHTEKKLHAYRRPEREKCPSA